MRLVALKILCITFLLGVIAYITWANNQAGQLINRGILVVMPRHSANSFNPDDFWDWEYGQIELERVFNAQIENENRTAIAAVSETSWGFLDMAIMTYRYGGHWRDEDSVIISQGLAWELFGNIDVVGLPLRVNGKLYTVTGVTWQEEKSAWILREESTENANIMYIKYEPYNWILANAATANLLESLGSRVEDHTITNINFYLRSMESRRFILFLLAVSFMIVAPISYFLQSSRLYAQIFVLCTMLYALVLLPLQEGYKQVFFNSDSLTTRQYLSGNLMFLYDLNLAVTVAFLLGIVSYAILIILWCIGFEKQPPSA